jgi:hypothetical protein
MTRRKRIRNAVSARLNGALASAGLRIVRVPADEEVFRASDAEALVRALTTEYRGENASRAECIVFSMDRALQLDALLGSYSRLAVNPAPIHILFRATGTEHLAAYEEVLERHRQRIASITRQHDGGSFRSQLLELLATVSAERVFFLVDDIVFVEEFDLAHLLAWDSRFFVPSLRLGANLRRSYTWQMEQQRPTFFQLSTSRKRQLLPDVPITEINQDDLLNWVWEEASLDWAYPLSVDGNLFSTAEIQALAEHTRFTSPNTFENNLQRFHGFFKHRIGVCYRKSRLVNVPWNRVQNEFDNVHGEVHQDAMLRHWRAGLRIDTEALRGEGNVSAHQEFPLKLVRR